jgi:hypothetical protein
MKHLNRHQFKKIIVILTMLLASKSSFCQWSGDFSTNGIIYRSGFVGIGTTSVMPNTILQVGNSLGFSSQSAQ